jgi:hypothetical protein
LGADMGGAAVDGTEEAALSRWAGGCEATGGLCCPGKASGGCKFWVDWWGVDAPFTAGPLMDGCGEAVGRVAFAAPWLMGVVRLVERLRMSLPCTTMLSLDFLRSRVSISARVSVHVARVDCEGRTVPTRVQVDYRPYADVYDAEEALVLLLELLLVEDLNREHALLVDLPGRGVSVRLRMEAVIAA